MNEPRKTPPSYEQHLERYAWLIDALKPECDEVRTDVGDHGWRFEVLVQWRTPHVVRIGIAPETQLFSLHEALAKRPEVVRKAEKAEVVRKMLRARPDGWVKVP